VPAATFFNVLGVFNAETRPSWKALFDATVPTTIAPSDAAAAGTAVAAARRDHLHGAPATFPATAHALLSATHSDILADSVLAGDVIIGNDTPKWSRLAIAVPAANVRNVLGIDNAETTPSWKTALDATHPADIAAAATEGTSLIFSHRDHVHAHPAIAGDLHTGYFLLAGRAGGQTGYGGTGASETLTLGSTAHGTKGNILLGADSTVVVDEGTGMYSSKHWAVGSGVSAVSATAALDIQETFSGALGATAYRGVSVAVTFDPNAAVTGYDFALRFASDVAAGNNNTFTWLGGLIGAVSVRGTGAKAHVLGVKLQILAMENNAVATDVIFFSAGGDVTAYTGTAITGGVWGLEINDLAQGFNSVAGEVVGIVIMPQDALGAAVVRGLEIRELSNATTIIPIYQAGVNGANRIVAKTMIGADKTPGSYALTVSSATLSSLLLEDTSADSEGARLDMKHISVSPAAWDIIMGQHYYGMNDAVVPEQIEYGLFRLYAVSVTDGAETGRYEWQVYNAGLVSAMVLTEASQLRLPVTGSGAGLLLGGDTQIYRGAADVLYSPDSLRLSGHTRVGNTGAPTNVTAGDLTCVRLIAGDAALAANVILAANGPATLSGYLRVGSATAPTNVTAGDVNATRLFVGADAGITAGYIADIIGALRVSTNLGVVTYARIGSSAVPLNVTAGDLTALRMMLGTDEALGVSVLLDLNSVTKAPLFPRMTTVERDALTAVEGMLIYNATTKAFHGYANGAWGALGGGGWAPLSPAPDFTLANVVETLTFDADDTTIDEVADVLGTVIQKLIDSVIFQ
jgi:hypothetical protein